MPSTSWSLAVYRAARRVLRLCPGSCDFRLHYVIAVQPEQLCFPSRLPRQISVRWLQPCDQPQLEQLRPALGIDYALRFADGHRCLGAFLSANGNRRLIAFIWIVTGPARMPTSFGCAWDLSATMLWLYDLHSSPGVLGALPHLYSYLRQFPPGASFTHWMGQNDFDNLRSHRSHLSLGFHVRALLWSVRLRSWRHLSRACRPRCWRWHTHAAGIPLPLFVPDDAIPPAPALSSEPNLVQLQCACGAAVPLSADTVACPICVRRLGQRHDGYFEVGPAATYWGELPQSEMQALLTHAQTHGWRATAAAQLHGSLYDYVSNPERVAFRDLLPLSRGARVLDIGAGWGSLAAPLARDYNVVALEGVAERARFIALRQHQDRLDHLSVLCGQFHRTTLAPRQFDGVVANGVLEWSALADLDDSPREAQLRFLVRLRELLKPGGYIYLAIENRFGREMFRGVNDHSGLPYTSLMPRWLAHRVCRTSHAYRAQNNVGYRTYTYSYRAYRRLFAEAGLTIAAAWVPLPCYNDPFRLVPLHAQAIRFAMRSRPHTGLRARAHTTFSRPWVWRWLASDFSFLLRATADAALSTPNCALEQDHAHA